MSAAELGGVDDLGARIEVPAGEVLVDQGDPGTHCFVVLDGTADVYANGEYVATNGRGSTIGEMALIDHSPRQATVVADGPMTLLRFDTRRFKALLEEMPKAPNESWAFSGPACAASPSAAHRPGGPCRRLSPREPARIGTEVPGAAAEVHRLGHLASVRRPWTVPTPAAPAGVRHGAISRSGAPSLSCTTVYASTVTGPV